MVTTRQLPYTRRAISDFEDDQIREIEDHEILGDSYRLEINLAQVTQFYHRALLDPKLQKFPDGQVTPFGSNSHYGHYPVKILEWLTLFRIFRNAVLRSSKTKAFQAYRRQNSWYLLAGEHGQAPCLISEYRAGKFIAPLPLALLINSNNDLLENYEVLISNGCIEPALEIWVDWLSKNPLYGKYFTLWKKISFVEIEKDLSRLLQLHYRDSARAKIKCGGLIFDWYSANPGHTSGFGVPFTYANPIR